MPLDQQQEGRTFDTGLLRGSMPFLDHLEELRRRLLKSLLAVIVMAILAFSFADFLMKILIIPLGDIQLYNIEVTGTFYAYLKVALIAGFAAAAPIIFYQLWMFISPGLYKKEKMLIIPIVTISTALFAGGAVFCYYLVLPIALQFLIGFSGELVIDQITIGSYISFAGLMMLAFGFAFQLPLVNYFLAKMGIITAKFLANGRRYAIVIILIVGAILTPPDVFTQVLLAGPLYILYEISIIVVKFAEKKPEKKA